jgi:hypothetical protein
MKLPISRDIEKAMFPEPIDGGGVQNLGVDNVMLGQTDNCNGIEISLTPLNGGEDTHKDTLAKFDIKSDISPPWFEVVRRGRNRSKSGKIGVNDRHILEF